MFNPVFHGSLLDPEHFSEELILFCFEWRGPKIKLGSPLLLAARTDCGKRGNTDWYFDVFTL